jgi:hypothetical protein
MRNIRLFASYFFLACVVLILYIILFPRIINVDTLDNQQMGMLAFLAVISTAAAWVQYPDPK